MPACCRCRGAVRCGAGAAWGVCLCVASCAVCVPALRRLMSGAAWLPPSKGALLAWLCLGLLPPLPARTNTRPVCCCIAAAKQPATEEHHTRARAAKPLQADPCCPPLPIICSFHGGAYCADALPWLFTKLVRPSLACERVCCLTINLQVDRGLYAAGAIAYRMPGVCFSHSFNRGVRMCVRARALGFASGCLRACSAPATSRCASVALHTPSPKQH